MLLSKRLLLSIHGGEKWVSVCVCSRGSGYYGHIWPNNGPSILSLHWTNHISTLFLWSTRHYLINNLHKRTILALLKSILTTVKHKLCPGHDKQLDRGWRWSMAQRIAAKRIGVKLQHLILSWFKIENPFYRSASGTERMQRRTGQKSNFIL